MSGFAGIVRTALSPDAVREDGAVLEKMAEAIAFRGPDARQRWQREGASFAFSLLGTGPAPQESAQPATLDGDTWLLGEARCDGRPELIRKLRIRGVPLSGAATDEQLVLHVFAQFGEQGLAELDGDFALVLWQQRRRRLLGFRDLTGARPFFYLLRRDALYFSNTVQALFADPAFRRDAYDLGFLGDFLLGSPHQDPERAVYRDVRRLPGGHLLEFSSEGFRVRRISNLPVEERLRFRSDREVIEEFRRLLTEAVRDRLPDGNTSILLSGGLDSTSIAAAIVGLRKGTASPLNLEGLCVDFEPLFDDEEGRYASRFARSLGIPLRLEHSGDVLPFADWDTCAHAFPEPPPDPYSLLYLSYRKQVSRSARVVFSGDGGDELLRLVAAPYLRFLAGREGAFAALRTLGRWLISHRGIPPLGFGIRRAFLRALGRKAPEPAYPPWLASEFERSHRLAERWREICAPPGSDHPFNPKAYGLLNGSLFGEVQELCDPTWTGVPLETRNPFLDRRLCRFLLRLPVVPWAMDKHLVRVAQKGVLPEEIRLRPKTPVVQDPLLLQVARGKWNPVPQAAPAPLLRSLVDWSRLLELLERTSDVSLYAHLRPVTLSRWLNAIEKGGLIQ